MAEQAAALTRATDTQLLTLLRNGNKRAYTELWRRHIDAALRHARQVLPDRAEDLAAEAFLAVYTQVSVKGKGPESAFRAYLFTTIRNLALSWSIKAQQVDTEPEPHVVHEEDPLTALTNRENSSELLAAFESLPERWQRVLWLYEVEQVKRPRIADELGIKPNAVSALYKRARAGFQLQWLVQQVPATLRNDPEHIASQLPQLVVNGQPLHQFSDHLDACSECAMVCSSLTEYGKRIRKWKLGAAGFAALSVTLPVATASLTPLGIGGVTLPAAKISLMPLSLVATTTAVVIGTTTLVSTLGLFPFDASEPEALDATVSTVLDDRRTGDSQSQSPAASNDRANDELAESADKTTAASDEYDAIDIPVEDSLRVGRGNENPHLESIDTNLDSFPNLSWVPPERPQPLDPTAAPPPPTSSTSPSELRTGITTPANYSGYLAPAMTGSTEPGAAVTIELSFPPVDTHPGRTELHSTTANSTTGAWDFDLRAVATESAGEYSYRVWASTNSETSPIDSGRFTVSPLELRGFEALEPFEPLPPEEAATTGIVFDAIGPANGMICLVSQYPGVEIMIPLDAEGVATRRIRFLAPGTYLLSARVCNGEYRGPPVEQFIDVMDPDGPPIFGPFLPDPDFVIEDL